MSNDTPSERLDNQIRFLVEVDALKRVLRQTPIIDGSRRENTAEHSWHLALAAIVLAEHANEAVDVAKVVQMLLVHDLVEIDAGDTFIYASNDGAHAAAIAATQQAQETAAADRIFGLLPPDQSTALRSLWDEFEAMATPEAKFAKAVDRVQPMLLNHESGGGSWRAHAITADQPRRLIDKMVPPGSTVLADYFHAIIDDAEAKAMFAEVQDQRPL